MDLTKLRKPNVNPVMVKNLVQLLYGLEVTTMEKMNSFNDQNFHIQVSQQHHNPFIAHVSTDGYTLKIINTAKSALDHHFESMHSAMMHLHNKGIRVPLPVMNLKGCSWSLQDVPLLSTDGSDRDEGKCGIHLLTYLPGEPLSSETISSDIFFQWGSLTAKIENALQDLSCPALKDKPILYSLMHIPEIVKFMEGLDEKKKKLVDRVLEKYEADILKHMNVLPKGFIHGDSNAENLLKQMKENDVVPSVDGLVDFEDMHYGTYLWDVGLMLASTMVSNHHSNLLYPIEEAGHVLAGYLSLRSLNELEMSLLKICIECRLCQSAILCEYSSSVDPQNSYVSCCATSIQWNLLQLLSNIRNEDLLKKWKEIQQQHQKI